VLLLAYNLSIRAVDKTYLTELVTDDPPFWDQREKITTTEISCQGDGMKYERNKMLRVRTDILTNYVTALNFQQVYYPSTKLHPNQRHQTRVLYHLQ